MSEKKERICPKCGAKCNYKDNTKETIYIWCTNKKCNLSNMGTKISNEEWFDTRNKKNIQKINLLWK